ncbi:MAG: hypothetical protein M1829_003009 [Trizodia sp. TS-e1964]|nr:MAG: hypothetical protein M1829_003009 [Trizodia sp. TS-e1964]
MASLVPLAPAITPAITPAEEKPPVESAGDGAAVDASASNANDFVRKLYKMLEDPAYSEVVCWGKEGLSFVVLENEKFTKSILPRHFKHSNFASFVRQLNKYDFHKVRQNTEEYGMSPYGTGAWEFKHPDFQANNIDSLDNIRRKAPAPRKPGPGDDTYPTQQLDLVNTQLAATQRQLQQLQQRYDELSVHHQMILQDVVVINKTMASHERSMLNVMNYLQALDTQNNTKANGRFTNQFLATDSPGGMVNPTEHPVTPLQNASKLLTESIAEANLNIRNLGQTNGVYGQSAGPTSPPSPNSGRRDSGPLYQGVTASAGPSSLVSYARLNGDMQDSVYPVGQSNGNDSMFNGHTNSIPYSLPLAAEGEQANVATPSNNRRKKSILVDPGWSRAPQILLVEDDPTCRRIGGKFLQSFKCAIDSAFNGVEAVEKIHSGKMYDLILMDIIMPKLDGVSACTLVRAFDSTPIIAMTSNIRSDDISMYFRNGMNDVLPKPFTKEGLLTLLEKHLGHLKKGAKNVQEISPTNPTVATRNLLLTSDSSARSPENNWQSATPLPVSPKTRSSGEDFSRFSGVVQPTEGVSAPLRSSPHRRGVSDISGGPEIPSNHPKRQRMFPSMSAPFSSNNGMGVYQTESPDQFLRIYPNHKAMSKKAPKTAASASKKKRDGDEREDSLQAVHEFSRLTQGKSAKVKDNSCLLPLANTPMIEYTLEFLANAGVEQVFLYCGDHADALETYIQSSKWVKSSSPFTKLEIIKSSSQSVGDAMRDLDQRAIMAGDFIMVHGDIVSNIPLEEALSKHRARREMDKNAIMTMVLREAGPDHRSKATQTMPIFVVDPIKDRCLHYEEINPRTRGRHVNIDPALLKEHSEIEIRNDLIDCYIDICTPDVLALWTDDFDYEFPRKQFLFGVLKDYELNGKTIHTHIMSDLYGSRVRDLHAYDAVSKDIISRWSYPLCPDSNLVYGQHYELQRGNIYKEGGIVLARSCSINQKTVIGEKTSIGDGSVISNSTIGRRCLVGKNVVIDGAYIWDDVVIGDGSEVRQVIVANEAVIGSDCRLLPGSLISYGVQLAKGVTIPGGSRIVSSRRALSPNAPSTDEELVGKGGEGYNYKEPEEDDDEDVEDSFPLMFGLADSISDASSTISTVSALSADDESFTSDPSRDGGLDNYFDQEASSSLFDSFQREHANANISLELSSLRLAADASDHQMRVALATAYIKMISHLMETQSLGASDAVKRVLVAHSSLLSLGIFDREREEKSDQVDFLLAVQKDLVKREKGAVILLFMAKELYDLDVLEGEAIEQWWGDARSMEGADMTGVRGQTEVFVSWLGEEEDDDDEDDSE